MTLKWITIWRIVIFLCVLIWPLWWAWQVAQGAVGPDPGNFLLLNFGFGALRLLLIVLSLTPLYRLTGWRGFGIVRRQLGLWCFTYACLHFACYLLFIIGLSLDQLFADLTRRPYIIVGMVALLGLTALAITSPKSMVRRLGKRWKKLHRLVYPVLLLVLLHFFWIVRADLGQWGIYAAMALCLFVLRYPPLARLLGRPRASGG